MCAVAINPASRADRASRVAEFASKALWRNPLELMLESTGEGIYGIDLNGCCVFINRAGAALLGYTVDQVLGHNMHELIHHSRPDGSAYPVACCPIYTAFREGRPCRIDSEMLWRADGSGVAVEYASYPILDHQQIAGAVVTFVDISARKQHEAQLRQAHEALEERVGVRTRELSEALAEVARSNERLRRLSAHLESVREGERSRIAREIHDELGSVLVALKLDLGWLHEQMPGGSAAQAKTRSMAGLIDDAVTEVGRIITDLRPSILDHQGLWAALDWHAQEFLEATGLRGELHIEVGAGVAAPDDAVATAAYRIFQEILNNVARHANATAIDMRVSADADELRLRVRDNGHGVTLEQLRHPGSHGVIGMSERARHFGGRLAIGPAASGGTQVRVWLPLTTAAGRRRPEEDDDDSACAV